MSLRQFQKKFATDAACRAFLEASRWGEHRCCPHCGSTKTHAITGASARNGLYQCGEKECRLQFTVTVGTIFHRSHVSLPKWFTAAYLMLTSSKGVSAMKVADWIGVTYKTAWFMCHRLRKAMANHNDLLPALAGIVEMDETYVGGRPAPGRKQSKAGRGTSKQLVFVAVERGGLVKTRPAESHGIDALKPIIKDIVDPSANIVTDEMRSYPAIGRDFQSHKTVNHGKKQYVGAPGVHVNTAESFNATLQRALIGVYHYMSKRHVHRYSDESAARWNIRKTCVTEIKTRNGKVRYEFSVLKGIKQFFSGMDGWMPYRTLIRKTA